MTWIMAMVLMGLVTYSITYLVLQLTIEGPQRTYDWFAHEIIYNIPLRKRLQRGNTND